MDQSSRRSHVRHVWPLVVVLALLALPVSAANSPKLTLSVDGRNIVATGISPGSTAVFVGASRVPNPAAYMNRVARWAQAVDDTDHDGVVMFTLPQPVPAVSVWAVVDLRDAKYALINGSRVGLRRMEVGNPLRKSAQGAVDRVLFNRRSIELLYVKPGLGAIEWTVDDGWSSDEGPPNGQTMVSLPKGKTLAGERPVNFTPGGVLIAIDIFSVEIAVIEFDQPLIGGAR